jgi:hypothetical protein
VEQTQTLLRLFKAGDTSVLDEHLLTCNEDATRPSHLYPFKPPCLHVVDRMSYMAKELGFPLQFMQLWLNTKMVRALRGRGVRMRNN